MTEMFISEKVARTKLQPECSGIEGQQLAPNIPASSPAWIFFFFFNENSSPHRKQLPTSYNEQLPVLFFSALLDVGSCFLGIFSLIVYLAVLCGCGASLWPFRILVWLQNEWPAAAAAIFRDPPGETSLSLLASAHTVPAHMSPGRQRHRHALLASPLVCAPSAHPTGNTGGSSPCGHTTPSFGPDSDAVTTFQDTCLLNELLPLGFSPMAFTFPNLPHFVLWHAKYLCVFLIYF